MPGFIEILKYIVHGQNKKAISRPYLPMKDVSQLFIVKDLILVQVGQLFAQRDGVFPVLGLFKQGDDGQVELLFSFPFSLARIPVLQYHGL